MKPWEKYQSTEEPGPWSKYQEPTSKRITPVQPENTVPESTTGRFVAGMGGGMVHLVEGTWQRVLEGAEATGIAKPGTSKAYQEYIDETRKIDKPLMETTAGKVGEIVGQSVPLAAIPGGGASRLMTRIGGGMAAGAATGALQPTTSDESPIMNVGIGALGGTAGVGVAAGISKGYNIAKGPTKDVIQGLADKYRIRVTLGEITRNPIIQKAETWLEAVPLIGLKRFREKQQVEAENAAKSFVSKYVIDPNAPDAMKANRAYASSLFEDLKGLVKEIPNQEIEPTQSREIASALLERYPDIFKKFQDTKRETLLKDIISGTKDEIIPAVTEVSPILDRLGRPYTKTTPEEIIPSRLTFKEAWTLRDGLGEMIGQARRKLVSGEVDQTTLGQLKALFRAVNNDIDNWANSIGRSDVRTAINTANDAYKNYVVKYDVIQRAMDKAKGTVGAGEMFSPKKFSTALKAIAYKDKALNRFRPDEIQEMTGLANIMQVVKRAGQYAENPPTGNRWGLPFILAEAGTYTAQGTPAAVATGAGLIGMTGLGSFLTGTRIGKAIALSASRIEPDSPQMAKLMTSLYQQAAKVSAVAAVNEKQNIKSFLGVQ